MSTSRTTDSSIPARTTRSQTRRSSVSNANNVNCLNSSHLQSAPSTPGSTPTATTINTEPTSSSSVRSTASQKRSRKQVEQEDQAIATTDLSSSSVLSLGRSSVEKGKKKVSTVPSEDVPEPKRPRRSTTSLQNRATTSSSAFNSTPDLKGKGRASTSLSFQKAAPFPRTLSLTRKRSPRSASARTSSSSSSSASSSSSLASSLKQTRSRGKKMARKPRSSAGKVGQKSSKGFGSASGSRKGHHNDIDMDDEHDESEQMISENDEDEEDDEDREEEGEEDEEEEEEEGEPTGADVAASAATTTKPGSRSSGSLSSNPPAGSNSQAESSRSAAQSMADAMAAAIYGGGFGGLGGGGGLFGGAGGGYASGLTTRLKSILGSIRSKSMIVKLSALQEASEVLSVSTEDTLAGYFQTDAFVKEFVAIMAGKESPANSPKSKSTLSQDSKPSGARAKERKEGFTTHEEDEDDRDDDGDEDEDNEEDEEEEDEDGDEDDHDEEDEDDDGAGFGIDMDEDSEDAQLARILALSAQEAFGEDGVSNGADNSGASAGADAISNGGAFSAAGLGQAEPTADQLEAQLLACRCLANLMEALPGSAHTVVYHGAVPVLCSKLLDIQSIDLAEQTMSTMEKISQEYPSAIVREGGLGALLSFLDFFSTHVQRVAVTAAANCCRNISQDHFNMVRDIFPMLRNVLGYPDQRLVEQATLAVVRSVESFRHKAESLETLLDLETIRALNRLLGPTGGSSLLSPGTYTHLLRALSTAARTSPKVTVAFLEAGMAETLYQIFTGVLPGSRDDEEQGNGPSGQGLGGGLADMVVLQALAHRPKDQVEEALGLVCELLPPLPRDGVFDQKSYTEKALARLLRGQAKEARAARAAARQAQAVSSENQLDSSETSSPLKTSPPAADDAADALTGDADAAETATPTETPSGGTDDLALPAIRAKTKELAQANEARIKLLKSRSDLTTRFVDVIVPVLVDVYAGSVALRVRSKVLVALLKTVSHMTPDELMALLKFVPLASFLGSIMSSRDDPTLIQGALQLIEILLTKLPQVYRSSFRREGVLYEVETLAGEELTTAKVAATAIKIEQDDSLSVSKTTPSTPSATPVATIASRSASSLFTPNLSNGAIISSSIKLPTPIDSQDLNILRARVLKAKTTTAGPSEKAGEDEADRELEKMKALVKTIVDEDAGVVVLKETISELAQLFGSDKSSVSSFELLKSGLVDGLLECAIIDGKASAKVRRSLLFEIFAKEDPKTSVSPLSILVKRLQESLSKMESFEVTTAVQGSAADDSRRGSTALLARQIRLKLVAEDTTDVPKPHSVMVVSIQAIATFQALNDYLRPRLSTPASRGGPGGLGSGLSAMYAAYAAAAGLSGDQASGRGLAASGSDNPFATGAVASTSSSSAAPASSESSSALAVSSASSSTKSDRDSEETDKPRRRSARLSGRAPDEETSATTPTPNPASTSTPTNGSNSARARFDRLLRESARELIASGDLPSALEAALQSSDMDYGDDFDEEGMYSDEDFDDEDMFDGDLEDALPQVADKAVDLNVVANGSKIEAKTPDGTRVATPTHHDSVSSTSAGAASSVTRPPASSGSGSSYASALKAKPTDWHLEFSMDGNPINLDATIYGAVLKNETKNGVQNGLQKGIWSGVYMVNFKRVPGAAPVEDRDSSPEPSTKEPSSATAVPNSVPSGSPQAKILRLLRVLHALSTESRELSAAVPTSQTLSESAFVNNKLTAKLGRQLEEPMILASSCLPDWAVDLPRFFPFLFPFETRFTFLHSTSFGYARLIQKWQSQQSRQNDSRADDSYGFLARLPRQKVRISRSHLLESAIKVFELYGKPSSILEVEYFEEVGTGLGPTLEFYALASKEFGRRDLKMWRDADADLPGDFVHRPQGLFPRPYAADEASKTDIYKKSRSQTQLFHVLGQFVAKALLDSRIIDMSFNTIFLKFVLAQEVVPSIEILKAVDRRLGMSLDKVQEFANAKAMLVDEDPSDIKSADGSRLSDFCLDFTLPGYDIELKEGGGDIAVDISNVEEYIEKVLDLTLVSGIKTQVNAFREGFSAIFPVRDLQAFSADELGILFGSAEEDWSVETLTEVMKADHGFNIESRTISNLTEVISQYDAQTRREFLQFVTGAPKLPIGGFRGLNPPLTVVRKGHEPPLKADDYLPSVMTCVNYLKLPDYSTQEILQEKLSTAMREGGGSFHLS